MVNSRDQQRVSCSCVAQGELQHLISTPVIISMCCCVSDNTKTRLAEFASRFRVSAISINSLSTVGLYLPLLSKFTKIKIIGM